MIDKAKDQIPMTIPWLISGDIDVQTIKRHRDMVVKTVDIFGQLRVVVIQQEQMFYPRGCYDKSLNSTISMKIYKIVQSFPASVLVSDP